MFNCGRTLITMTAVDDFPPSSVTVNVYTVVVSGENRGLYIDGLSIPAIGLH